MRSPKGNINPPLVIQGEVDFAKQKTEGLKKTQSIYEICRKKDVNNFHTKKDCLQKDRKVNTNIKINHSDEWFVLNVGVSSKHILYRTKHSFVNILHMFFLSQQAQAACCVLQFKHKVEVDIKKDTQMSVFFYVGVDLFSQEAALQLFSARVSLTTVFGMGTGGPSA